MEGANLTVLTPKRSMSKIFEYSVKTMPCKSTFVITHNMGDVVVLIDKLIMAIIFKVAGIATQFRLATLC